MPQPLIPPPGEKVVLADFDPRDKSLAEGKAEAKKETRRNVKALRDLSQRLWAEDRRAVLVILQGMDTSGKDGTIKHVLTGVNPQMCQVTAFKQPSDEERDHDFLWRIHRAIPRRGAIGIFNRSHYEDVLAARVHKLVPEHVWRRRYDAINQFEQLLTADSTTIVKFFLHIGKDEQRERLQARLDNPKKRWKFSPGDLAERALWDDYRRAYEELLTRCNTPRAPWRVIPADRKWYRNLLVSRALRETLERLDPQFPEPAEDLPERIE